MYRLRTYANKIFRCALYVFLSISAFLSAADQLIFETSTLSAIKEHLSDSTLIVFDIDNTLLEPVQALGSDQWAWGRLKELKAKGLSESEAFQQTMKEWREVHAITKVRSPESMTPELIQELQNKGYPLIALTTRAPEDADVTIRELLELGINLTRSSLLNQSLDLPLNKHAQFKEGILFISLDNKKGIALKEFLNKIGYHPQKVIFIDDKLSHIQDVQEACVSLDIGCVGIRYSATDQRVKAYDCHLAERQWFFLHNLLSDDEAALLTKGKTGIE